MAHQLPLPHSESGKFPGQEIFEVDPDISIDFSKQLTMKLLLFVYNTLRLLNKVFDFTFKESDHQGFTGCLHKSKKVNREFLENRCQFNRLGYIGLLLRTSEKLFELESIKLRELNTKLMELQMYKPDWLHGVAVLHFLGNGLCWNDIRRKASIQKKLILQIQTISKYCKTCTKGYPFKITDFFREGSNNCLLRLLQDVVQSSCDHCRQDKEVSKCLEELDLKGLNPVACGDCESMLIDVLVYARLLQRNRHRMLASVWINLEYLFPISVYKDPEKNISFNLLETGKKLFQEGYKEVEQYSSIIPKTKKRKSEIIRLGYQYEIMFISGWLNEKKDNLDILLEEGFLHRKEKRPFFIQCKHHLRRSEEDRKCCEPQILKHITHLKLRLNQILSSANMGPYSNHSLNMVIEQSPCNSCCILEIIPCIAQVLCQNTFNFFSCQSLMPYFPGTHFLERLIDSGAVVLKNDLKPFSNRQDCMTHCKCNYTTCHHRKEYYICHYSKPDKVLAVHSRLAAYVYKYYITS